MLEQEHRKLRAAVSKLRQSKAPALPRAWIFGVAFHDIYHAGQIQMLRRLRRGASRG